MSSILEGLKPYFLPTGEVTYLGFDVVAAEAELQKRVVELERDIDRMLEANGSLVKELEQSKRQVHDLLNKKFAHFANEECWIYQGEGDQLESLTCPVVISAAELLELLELLELHKRVAELELWREAVIEGLIASHIYTAAHDTDPRKALADLLGWEIAVALDPSVSSEAQALIDKGRQAASVAVPEGWREDVYKIIRELPAKIAAFNFGNGEADNKTISMGAARLSVAHCLSAKDGMEFPIISATPQPAAAEPVTSGMPTRLRPTWRGLEREPEAETSATAVAAGLRCLAENCEMHPELHKPALLKVPTCEWSLSTEYDGDAYESACGEKWSFIEGGIAENGVRFCQGCGGRVVQKGGE